MRVPGVVRRLFFRLLLQFPGQFKKRVGTLLVTAVGMFGGGVGWGFSAPGIHNLSVVIGGIATRAADSASQSEMREVLCLTVSANHEVVDGAPLARFVSRLRQLIEAPEDLLATAELGIEV